MRDRSMKRNNGRSLLGLDDNIASDNDVYNNQMSQSEQMLAQHNEERIEALGEKVHVVKILAGNIGEQVSESNRLLTEMEGDISNVSAMLNTTVTKIKQLAKSGGGWHMCYMVLFMLFVFMLLYFMMGSSSSKKGEV
eukprot:Phypoly_transcript_24111.p1 GENE.Phypoly_transcript_24111~~Phypoly_transcript_24111.p1  ORF type:complete len:137 (+),score=24.36 Phypoly_transcript_24111:118-528(+)